MNPGLQVSFPSKGTGLTSFADRETPLGPNTSMRPQEDRLAASLPRRWLSYGSESTSSYSPRPEEGINRNCAFRNKVRPNTACRRRGYRRAPDKALVILADLAREGVFSTRPAPDANRWAAIDRICAWLACTPCLPSCFARQGYAAPERMC